MVGVVVLFEHFVNTYALKLGLPLILFEFNHFVVLKVFYILWVTVGFIRLRLRGGVKFLYGSTNEIES